MVRDRLRVPARPAADAPVVAVVAVEVGADRGRARGRLAVLAPEVEVPVLDVERRRRPGSPRRRSRPRAC